MTRSVIRHGFAALLVAVVHLILLRGVDLRVLVLFVVPPLVAFAALERSASKGLRRLALGFLLCVALGAVVVTQPEIIILDEPTRGLDQRTKKDLLELLLEWNQNGKTILLVTHEVEFAAAFASRILILEGGQIVSQGDPRLIMRTHPRYTPQIARLYPDTDWLTLDDLPS